MAKRPKPKSSTSAGEIGQLEFNEQSFAHREVTAGGVYDIMGTATAAKRVGLFASLRIVNTDSVGHFVAIGPAAVAAPTDLTNGHWLAPMSETFLSTGELGDYVRADSATVGVYRLKETVVIADDDRVF